MHVSQSDSYGSSTLSQTAQRKGMLTLLNTRSFNKANEEQCLTLYAIQLPLLNTLLKLYTLQID